MVFAGNYLHASLVTIFNFTFGITLNILIFMSDTINYEILHLGYFFYLACQQLTLSVLFCFFVSLNDIFEGLYNSGYSNKLNKLSS